jgi:hypothetical protein
VRKTQKGRPTILDRILEAVRKENPPTSWVGLISEKAAKRGLLLVEIPDEPLEPTDLATRRRMRGTPSR